MQRTERVNFGGLQSHLLIKRTAGQAAASSGLLEAQPRYTRRPAPRILALGALGCRTVPSRVAACRAAGVEKAPRRLAANLKASCLVARRTKGDSGIAEGAFQKHTFHPLSSRLPRPTVGWLILRSTLDSLLSHVAPGAAPIAVFSFSCCHLFFDVVDESHSSLQTMWEEISAKKQWPISFFAHGSGTVLPVVSGRLRGE